MLIEKLSWRYATKKMDPTKKIPKEKLERILDAIRLAPTSSGLQPFEVLNIISAELRDKIRKVAWNQSQVTEASHLLVFAAWDNYTEARINAVYDNINMERGVSNEGLEAYRQRLLSTYPKRDEQTNYEHAARQAYIAFGFALAAAAVEEVDATPMEGFEPEKVDEILGLRARGLRSVLLLPLGFRDANNDWLVNLKKVRRARKELFTDVE
jgi:nitroreductase / dihydropteridine reductase